MAHFLVFVDNRLRSAHHLATAIVQLVRILPARDKRPSERTPKGADVHQRNLSKQRNGGIKSKYAALSNEFQMRKWLGAARNAKKKRRWLVHVFAFSAFFGAKPRNLKKAEAHHDWKSAV
jgi:hypothetical protein